MQQLVLENNAPIELGGGKPTKALPLNFSREKKEKKRGGKQKQRTPRSLKYALEAKQ
jgi:hypothetical protein